MSPSARPEFLESFFRQLRETGFQLGLDPEFSTIEKLATAPSAQRLPMLREIIDQFFWANGFPVLERLQKKAAENKDAQVEQVLGSMRHVIDQFFKGQFVRAPQGQQLPQPAMLREMLRLINTYDAAAIIKFVDENIQYLDGHFFMSLSESLRNARGRGHEPTMEALVALGRMVAEKRIEHGLPCTFRALYGV